MSAQPLAVIGESDDRGGYVVGPVYTDVAADQVRDEIEARGDTVRGTVPLVSVARFRQGVAW